MCPVAACGAGRVVVDQVVRRDRLLSDPQEPVFPALGDWGLVGVSTRTYAGSLSRCAFSGSRTSSKLRGRSSITSGGFERCARAVGTILPDTTQGVPPEDRLRAPMQRLYVATRVRRQEATSRASRFYARTLPGIGHVGDQSREGVASSLNGRGGNRLSRHLGSLRICFPRSGGMTVQGIHRPWTVPSPQQLLPSRPDNRIRAAGQAAVAGKLPDSQQNRRRGQKSAWLGAVCAGRQNQIR